MAVTGVHAARRAALHARLATAGVDALLVTHLVNVRYLTGFTGSAAKLLVTTGGDHLVTDGRYETQVAQEAGDLPRTITRAEDWLDAHVTSTTVLGLDSDHLSWDAARAMADRFQIVAAPGHPEALRLAKDDAELAALTAAARFADDAFTDLCTWLAPGLTERHVARRLDAAMLDGGADAISFETVCASGPAAALPHHRPDDRALARGDVVLLDFGALVDGYHSDMTRMVALGTPDATLASVFDIVRDAQQAGVEALAEGVELSAVDAACRDAITAAGLGDRFVHPTGHGVGLDIHEAPRLAAGGAGTIAARMVVTVEPGVYLPGLGGVRIEDTVALDGDARVRILTRTPKDLVVL